MNLKTRLLKCKQELPSIAFVATVGVWWCFHWPTFVRLGNPWSTVVAAGMSLVLIVGIIFIFSSMDRLAPSLKLDYVNDSPFPSTSKKIIVAAKIAAFVIVMFYVWYKDWYGLSNTHYAFLYAYWLISYALIYRAAHRVNSGSC